MLPDRLIWFCYQDRRHRGNGDATRGRLHLPFAFRHQDCCPFAGSAMPDIWVPFSGSLPIAVWSRLAMPDLHTPVSHRGHFTCSKAHAYENIPEEECVQDQHP